MSQYDLEKKLTEIQELKRMQEDLAAEIEAAQDEIKAHMQAAGLDTLTAGAFKVTWTEITSTRIDTAALRKDLPEVWQEYGKTSTVRRFCIK